MSTTLTNESLRVCKVCGDEKPLQKFGPRGDGAHHKHTCSRCCYVAWRKKNRVGAHGLTWDERTELVERQGSCCACCGKKTTLVVDHDHESGHIRGALCTPCNLMLGHAKDDPERLRLAARYLETC